ncbi:Ulp1 peptidase [Ranunculus cassubicifolius]
MATPPANVVIVEGIDEVEVVNVEGAIASSPSSGVKRKLRSKVWLDFDKKKNAEGKSIATCKHCKRNFTAASDSGTSHLSKHLRSCPKIKNKDVRQQLIFASKDITSGTHAINSFKFDQVRSRLDLAQMIIKHEYPFTMVDHEYFRAFITNLQPLFKLVTRNTVKSDILTIFRDEKESLYRFFETFSGRISFTTDLWTSETQDAYLCLTAHYIDNDWNLQKKILNFVMMEGSHSSNEITKVIMACLLDWNVDKKVNTITLDNASTNDAMVRKVRDMLNRDNSLVLGGRFMHVRCTAHVLNLIVRDGLSVIAQALYDIRESCKFVKASPQRKLKWKSAVDQVRVETTKKICLDVATRWNSTYKMLKRALKYKEAFCRLAQREEDFLTNPSLEDWEMAKVICECLKIFYDSTKAVSGTEYPTANIYFPEVCEIHVSLLQWLKHENPLVVSMAERMFEKFKKYWSVCSLILAVAVVLDPRFKIMFVQFYYNLIYGADHKTYVTEVQSTLFELYNEYASQPNPTQSSQWSNISVGESSTGNGLNKFKRFETWCHKEGYDTTSNKSELEQYLEEPIFPSDREFKILNRWKMNSLKYPTLSKLARDILTIPVSSVASESAFSTGGRVLNEYRSSLAPETLQALICSQNWLKSGGVGNYLTCLV